jgi:hypothetical protein
MAGATHELVGAANPCEAMATIRVLHALLAAHAHHQELLVARHRVAGRFRLQPVGCAGFRPQPGANGESSTRVEQVLELGGERF